MLSLLAAYGLMFTLSQSSILEKPRNFLTERSELLTKLLKCSFCSGFWSGIIVKSLELQVLTTVSALTEAVLFGFSSAAFCYLLDTILIWLENDTDKAL